MGLRDLSITVWGKFSVGYKTEGKWSASRPLWISDTLRDLVALGPGLSLLGDSSRYRVTWEELEAPTGPLSAPRASS